MNEIKTLINKDSFVIPEKLMMSWQDPQSRLHRKIAILTKSTDEKINLEYIKNEPDFQKAQKGGFLGYPGLDIKSTPKVPYKGAIEDMQTIPEVIYPDIYYLFEGRVISKKRADYYAFLDSWRISRELKDDLDPFYILALTAGAMPGDPFYFFPIFPNDWNKKKLSLMLLIHGFRHEAIKSNVTKNDLSLDHPIEFEKHEDNKVDPSAYRFLYKSKPIGYLSRLMIPQFDEWIRKKYEISCRICRLNGQENPRVFANILVER